MTYSLKRIKGSSEEGDSGQMSLAIWTDGNEVRFEHNSAPRVGVCIRVGSNYARTYSGQDWWQTSYITEIVNDSIDETGNREIIFKTKNSVYQWKEF